MLINKILNAVDYSKSKSIDEILTDNNIDVRYISLESAYGIISIGKDKTIIFIDSALPWQCKEFVLWHEIGHFLLDYKYGEFHFEKNSRSELKANIFACIMLGGNMGDWIKQGCPLNIAVDVYNYLSQNVYAQNSLSDVYFF